MPHSCSTSHPHRIRPIYEPAQLRPQGRPTHAEIARLAYSYWEARGRKHGHAVEDWLRAERDLNKRA